MLQYDLKRGGKKKSCLSLASAGLTGVEEQDSMDRDAPPSWFAHRCLSRATLRTRMHGNGGRVPKLFFVFYQTWLRGFYGKKKKKKDQSYCISSS